jgi:phosphopantothenoylcysteine decarboxylase/phosphopantothenate--cysteine ligase
MRFISAHSSGRTGTSIATALLSAGANVTILGSPEATLRAPTASTTELFASTRDLMEKMQLWLEDHPNALVIHAAAVGDYEAKPQIGKIPSGSSELVLHLQPTPKILDQIRDWAPGCFLVSFKAAAPATTLDALNEIASAQLKRSNSDLVFGNIIGALSEAVILVSSDKSRNFPSREAGMNALLRHAIQALRG